MNFYKISFKFTLSVPKRNYSVTILNLWIKQNQIIKPILKKKMHNITLKINRNNYLFKTIFVHKNISLNYPLYIYIYIRKRNLYSKITRQALKNMWNISMMKFLSVRCFIFIQNNNFANFLLFLTMHKVRFKGPLSITPYVTW